MQRFWKKRFSINNLGEYAIIIAITSFFIAAEIIFSIKQYNSMNTTAFDLGVNANSLYNTFHGRLFYSSLLGYSMLGQHFSPIEFPMLLVYYVFKSPLSLMVFEDIFIAGAAIPLYLFYKSIISKINFKLEYQFIIGISIVMSYELSPFTDSLFDFPFHKMALLPFFFFLALYAYLENKNKLHLFSLIMIIALHSFFVVIVGSIILFELYYSRRNRDYGLIFSNLNRKKLAATFILIVVLLLSYLELASYLKGYINGYNGISSALNTNETGIPSGGIFGFIIELFTNPSSAIPYLSINHAMKLSYISELFWSTGYLAVIFPETLLMALPYIAYAMPSTTTAYYQIGYQYGAMVFPVFYISIVLGIARSMNYIKKHLDTGKGKHTNEKYNPRLIKYASIFIIVIMVLGASMSFQYSPLAPSSVFKDPEYGSMDNINSFHITNQTSFIRNEIKTIPRDSVILTQNNIAPFISNYPNIFIGFSKNINNYSDFDYIAITYNSGWGTWEYNGSISPTAIATMAMNSGTYGMYARDGNFIILEKNYSGKTIYPGNAKFFDISPDTLAIVQGKIVNNVLIESNVTGELWYGPYTFLAPGNYTVSYELETNNNSGNNYIDLDVSYDAGNKCLGSTNLTGNYLQSNSVYNESLNITVHKTATQVEFRAMGSNWHDNLRLIGIVVSPDD
jgi:uncharacterized membrane protein